MSARRNFFSDEWVIFERWPFKVLLTREGIYLTRQFLGVEIPVEHDDGWWRDFVEERMELNIICANGCGRSVTPHDWYHAGKGYICWNCKNKDLTTYSVIIEAIDWLLNGEFLVPGENYVQVQAMVAAYLELKDRGEI